MAKYQLTTGVQVKALRVCVYGVAGIGKTTLAAQFPNPVFIDVEDGSNQLPVARLPRPTSWDMLIDEVREVMTGNVPCSSIIIDTVDAAEELMIASICAKHSWDGLEGAGYGKGYTYAAEEFGRFLDLLGRVVDGGRNVVLVSHAMCRKFERPDEEGAYDRYELKLSKKVSPMVKEWSDMLLFCDYKTLVDTKSDKKGNVTKAKAKGGRRIIHTTFHVCWDAKNRFGLPDELPLDYASIAQCIPDMLNGGLDANLQPAQPMQQPQQPAPMPPAQPVQQQPVPTPPAPTPEPVPPMIEDANDPRMSYKCKPLADLMFANGVTDVELRSVVGAIGTRPAECAVNDYPEGFPEFLAANFADKVLPKVLERRQA